ncbi:MAG: EamA family transporter, partial [Pseudonocardiales bacterium]|nr:EamA family transporter [Pseudonocardiales bacterium]
VWGSTYLAISVMVRTIPPLYGMGIRFLAAGMVLLAWCAVRRGELPRIGRAEFTGAAVTGTLLLGIAYGLLGVAQRTVPSGLAAVVIASVPLWVVVLRTLHREPVPGVAQAGLLIGFAGVAVLMLPLGTGPIALIGLLLLVAAALAEATGAFYTPRLPHPGDLLVTASVQMLVAGALLTAAAPLFGEPFAPNEWSTKSVLGLLYLIGLGSVLAYASLVWLLAHVPVWLATTYAYVNPAVALLLGWLVLGEPLTRTTLLGSTLVIASVIFVAAAERIKAVGRGRQPAAKALGATSGDTANQASRSTSVTQRNTLSHRRT